METGKGIKSWSSDDRPREKLIEKGALALSDAELLAILIGSGSKDESAVDLSRRILKAVSNDLNKLLQLSLKELTNFKGIGPAKAVSVMAAMELAKRRRAQVAKVDLKVSCSQHAYERFLEFMTGLKHEEFWMMCLATSGKVITIRRVSEGGLSSTVVDIKKIFKTAIDHHAAKIIVAHNHPSGNLKPSIHDQQLTKRVLEAGNILDCRLEDHIIISDVGYFSFADEGLMSIV